MDQIQNITRLSRRTDRVRSALLACTAGLAALWPCVALAHHEALFGPQSSLAAESAGFVSLQTHTHATGIGGQSAQETTFIASGGFSPLSKLPLGITFVQPFTFQTSRVPTSPEATGPFTTCDGCFRRENVILSTQYRFDFKSLQRAFGKDGNFALVSAAFELPTGNKDYPALTGPFNYMCASMVGVEKDAWSTVALGYYRFNTKDASRSKKGDNFLTALGGAWTPIDEPDRMASLQLGLGYERHFTDLASGSQVNPSGGWEVLASPTAVWMPVKSLRLFAYVSLPLMKRYEDPSQVDRWRAGVGAFYAFSTREDESPGRSEEQTRELAKVIYR
jgi:hypothetical protein